MLISFILLQAKNSKNPQNRYKSNPKTNSVFALESHMPDPRPFDAFVLASAFFLFFFFAEIELALMPFSPFFF